MALPIPVVLEDLSEGRRHPCELAPEAGLRLGLRGQFPRVRVQERVNVPLGRRAQQVHLTAKGAYTYEVQSKG